MRSATFRNVRKRAINKLKTRSYNRACLEINVAGAKVAKWVVNEESRIHPFQTDLEWGEYNGAF